MKHTFRMRENKECLDVRGVPMYRCVCGKNYQTKILAERHCQKENKGD